MDLKSSMKRPPSSSLKLAGGRKNKQMYIGDGPDLLPVTARTLAVKFVNCLNYLGSIFMNTGNLNKEISWHQTLIIAIMQYLWKPLWMHRCITWWTKLHIYNASVISILLYISEMWLLSTFLAKKIDDFDLKSLNMIE